jgi:hypothetical protein
VITGLSGSGKSSLAFDTIYAEGQRHRYKNTHTMNKYKRILLKLSGEALAKDGNTVDPNTLSQVVDIIKSVLKQKVEVGIVVGGGNIFRGAALAQAGMTAPVSVVKHGEPVPAEKITTFPMLSACFALL